MNKRVFKMIGHQQRQRAAEFCWEIPTDYVVTFSEPTRSLDQNAAQWPILDAFSKQLQWPVNGLLCWLEPEEWKDILTAAFERENVRLAMAFDGPGVVMLGQRTSKYGKRKFSDWLEFLHAAAIAKGVVVYPDATAVDRGVSIPEEQAA